MFVPDYPLAGDRLLLRPYAAGDYDALHAMQSRADVNRYLYTDARSPEEVAQSLEGKIAAVSLSDEGDTLATAIVLRESGEMVGDCILHWVSRQHRCGEIGFIVHPDHHGRGYATEASRLLLRFGFDTVGFHRIIGRLEARNTASARVLEKLGMRREALLIENEWVKDEWQSEVVYAMLEREWLAQRIARA